MARAACSSTAAKTPRTGSAAGQRISYLVGPASCSPRENIGSPRRRNLRPSDLFLSADLCKSLTETHIASTCTHCSVGLLQEIGAEEEIAGAQDFDRLGERGYYI